LSVAPLVAHFAARSAGPQTRRAEASAVSDDVTTMMVEVGELHLLAEGRELELTPEQWSALANVALSIQALRQNYEAGIATAVRAGEGRYRVEIPDYAQMGKLIRGRFEAELRSELGESVAVEILTKLGSRLEAHFGGFGVSRQTLDIAVNEQSGASGCEITRTTTFWKNGENAAGGVATRRETIIPESEDPTGDRWAALLAVVLGPQS